MTTILQIECSPRGESSHSSWLARELVKRLWELHPDAHLIQRNLASSPPPHVDAAYTAAMRIAAAQRTPQQHQALAISEALIAELEGADYLVVSTPMHNFSVPAVLKAWIDQVVRARRTFQITPQGKVGLLQDRPVFVAIAAGGLYSGTEARQPDFLTPYLRHIFSTIGIHSVEFISLEGLAHEEPAIEAAKQQALDWIATRLPLKELASN